MKARKRSGPPRRPAVRRRWVINPRTRVKESARVYDRNRAKPRGHEEV